MSTCDGTRNIRAVPRRNQRHERLTKTVVTSPLRKSWPSKPNPIYTLEGLGPGGTGPPLRSVVCQREHDLRQDSGPGRQISGGRIFGFIVTDTTPTRHEHHAARIEGGHVLGVMRSARHDVHVRQCLAGGGLGEAVTDGRVELHAWGREGFRDHHAAVLRPGPAERLDL